MYDYNDIWLQYSRLHHNLCTALVVALCFSQHYFYSFLVKWPVTSTLYFYNLIFLSGHIFTLSAPCFPSVRQVWNSSCPSVGFKEIIYTHCSNGVCMCQIAIGKREEKKPAGNWKCNNWICGHLLFNRARRPLLDSWEGNLSKRTIILILLNAAEIVFCRLSRGQQASTSVLSGSTWHN